jgi:hypothetical protein
MNLKLRLASFWLPSFILKKEIDKVAEVTIGCLDQIINEFTSDELNKFSREKLIMKGNMENRRKIMSKAHNIRVKELINVLGYDEAVRAGRASLFKAGLKLGLEARERLGVGSGLQDLIRAARILYRVLGIEFIIIQSVDDNLMVVKKCSLSEYYTPETCKILSAADEGVVQGLNPNIHLIFTQRMTDGPSECVACISQEIN